MAGVRTHETSAPRVVNDRQPVLRASTEPGRGVESPPMRAEILTIGDELCRGEIVDTNSSDLAARLWDLAITTRWMTSCNDDATDITSAVSQAVARADLVVCSGGLGPTEDDLTVDVLARLAGVEPVIDEPARKRMEAWFAGRVEVAVGGVPVICMPGVPRELHAIVERSLRARLIELRDARPDREVIARQI